MRIIIAIIIKQFCFIAAFSFPPFSQRCCRFNALILASQTDGVNSFFATIGENAVILFGKCAYPAAKTGGAIRRLSAVRYIAPREKPPRRVAWAFGTARRGKCERGTFAAPLLRLIRAGNCTLQESMRSPLLQIKRPPAAVFLFGAGNGNRTRLHGLGSRYSTDELCLHYFWMPIYFTVKCGGSQDLLRENMPTTLDKFRRGAMIGTL